MSAHENDRVTEVERLRAQLELAQAVVHTEARRARREEARANRAEKDRDKAKSRLASAQQRLAALEGPKEPKEAKERPTHSTKPPQLKTAEECWAALQRMRREVGKGRRSEADFWNEGANVCEIGQGIAYADIANGGSTFVPTDTDMQAAIQHGNAQMRQEGW